MLNELISNIDSIPEDIRVSVRNNGGGHSNHSLFWQIMGSKGGNCEGRILEKINENFGSFENLRKIFGNGRFSFWRRLDLVDCREMEIWRL